MVPESRTIMEPQMIQQARTVYETHSRSVQVPRVVMEDHVVETKHPKIEMTQNTIQVCDPSQSPGGSFCPPEFLEGCLAEGSPGEGSRGFA